MGNADGRCGRGRDVVENDGGIANEAGPHPLGRRKRAIGPRETHNITVQPVAATRFDERSPSTPVKRGGQFPVGNVAVQIQVAALSAPNIVKLRWNAPERR